MTFKALAPLIYIASVALLGCETDLETSLDADAGLYETTNGSTANGQGSVLVVGHSAAADDNIRRFLVKFSLPEELPENAKITSAQLQMTVISRGGSVAQTLELHRVTSSWEEGSANADNNADDGVAATNGDVTWLHRSFDSSNWVAEGGDFVSTLSSSTEVSDTGLYVWDSSSTMIADVQLWADNDSANHGWIVVANSVQAGILHRFASGESSDSGDRPELVVTYNTPLTFGE
jgi:hypothetical protein